MGVATATKLIAVVPFSFYDCCSFSGDGKLFCAWGVVCLPRTEKFRRPFCVVFSRQAWPAGSRQTNIGMHCTVPSRTVCTYCIYYTTYVRRMPYTGYMYLSIFMYIFLNNVRRMPYLCINIFFYILFNKKKIYTVFGSSVRLSALFCIYVSILRRYCRCIIVLSINQPARYCTTLKCA
jgi:hypothetical protein